MYIAALSTNMIIAFYRIIGKIENYTEVGKHTEPWIQELEAGYQLYTELGISLEYYSVE